MSHPPHPCIHVHLVVLLCFLVKFIWFLLLKRIFEISQQLIKKFGKFVAFFDESKISITLAALHNRISFKLMQSIFLICFK